MKCTFCDKEMEPGTGTMYIRTDGKVWHFCSSKCENNKLKLKRNPRYVRWTGVHEKGGKK